MSKILISCGGTGGHLSPGIAIAEGLMERGHDCTLIISNKEVDSRLIENYPDLSYERIPGIGFSIRPIKFMKFLYWQAKGLWKSLNLIKEKEPDIVMGFGGFTTVGMALAAFLLNVPVVLHEANRKTGKAIRCLSVIANRIYLPPGVHLKSLPPKTIRHLGYPVRKEIRPVSKQVASLKLGLKSDRKRLLVLGGSQGASVLNKWVLDNFEKLGAHGIDVYCVTGMGKCSQGKLEYISELGDSAQAIFTPFVDNMSYVLCSADLVVSRSGAGSIAEFSRCCLPSILVPYPHAADNHQLENARFHEMQACGIVIEEKDINKLYDEVLSIIYNDWLLNAFQKNLQKTEVKNSLDLIVKDLELLCGKQDKISE